MKNELKYRQAVKRGEMNWYIKSFSNIEKNGKEYRNMIREIEAQFHHHSNKLKQLSNNNGILSI